MWRRELPNCLLIVFYIQSILLEHTLGYDIINLTVGAIIDENAVAQIAGFRKSVQEANKLLQQQNSHNRTIQLVPLVETIVGDDSFEASRKACKLLESQVIALYGPNTPNAVNSVQSLANRFGIPHLQIDWGYVQPTRGFALNVHPHYVAYGQALYDYVKKAELWDQVALIYFDEDSLLKYDYLLRNFDQPVMLRKWDLRDDNHRYVIKQFNKDGNHKRFIVDIPSWAIPEFISLADSYNMTSQYFSYIFTDWDTQYLDQTTFKSVEGANITTFSILQPTGDTGYGLGPLTDDIRMAEMRDNNLDRATSGTRPVSPTLLALLYDGLSLLAMGLLSTSKTADLRPPDGMTCTSSRVWSPGLSLINNIKAIRQENFRGLTGTFQFDGNGWRSNINLRILELTMSNFREYGYWDMDEGLTVTKNFSLARQEMQSELKGKVLRITTKEEKPYMMYAGNTGPEEPKSTNPRDWRGFCIDLLNEIGKELNFTYTINLVADSTYGNMKKVDGREVWDGMVKELQTLKADLAVGSFTITYDRDRVIDFTTPFMYLGISIIYKRIEDKGSNLFSFLQPLSTPVWGYILAATIMVSLVLFVIARFSPYEWKLNHPCNVNSNMVENKFNVLNSFWYTFGALMQKGSDVVPHATSTRIIAGFWWFFTLIVISSYTANLAAFLTVARMEAPIENAEDLAKQTKIKYGTIQGGSTAAFFEQSNFSTYKRMWQYMKSIPGLMMNSTEEAIRRVKNEEYAYILESTMNEYYTQRDCELMQVGGLLDSKGYGIGLPEGSKYRDPISETILKLQNNQVINKLQFHWWRERDINVSCDAKDKKKSDTSSLGVEKVGGCFVMLLIGMGASILVSTMEFVYNSYHRVSPDKRSVREEIARDFRFSMACSSIRSHMAEEATKLPPPPELHCISGNDDKKSTLSAALAYAPCLPPPDFPVKVDRSSEIPIKEPSDVSNRIGSDSDADQPPLMIQLKSGHASDLALAERAGGLPSDYNTQPFRTIYPETPAPFQHDTMPYRYVEGMDGYYHPGLAPMHGEMVMDESDTPRETGAEDDDDDDDGEEEWLPDMSPEFPGSPINAGQSMVPMHSASEIKQQQQQHLRTPMSNSNMDAHIKKVSC